MSTIQFLGEWALRSSILISAGALLLLVLRVKDPSIRLAAWVAMLCASLAMPLFTASVPKAPFVAASFVAIDQVIETPKPVYTAPLLTQPDRLTVPKRFDWPRAALIVYAIVALALLLRLFVGLAMSLRLLRGSKATGQSTEGIEIRDSDIVTAPVTLGIARPAVVLPVGWREWDEARLNAVLAHERSHIRRFDPAVQFLSGLHRALLWHSPMSWFLHKRIVRAAEEASDDAALAVSPDRAFYAEVLLGFMRRGGARIGVPMARYGTPDARIHRILDSTTLSRGVTRWALAVILAAGSPIAYLVAAAHTAAQPAEAPPAQATIAQAKPLPPQTSPKPLPARPRATPGYLRGLGNVAASATVVVKPRMDGELKSLGFKDGDLIQQGQLLASLDSRSLEIQFMQAQGNLEQDQKQLNIHRGTRPSEQVPLQVKVNDDQAEVDNAKLRLDYAEIRSPIAGIAGLRMVDAGNMVHAGEPIVVITQLQPAAVLFTLPEDTLPRIHAGLAGAANPVVEAWNRDNTVKIATGRLAAIDNQIDPETGTIKLKAVFDNNDSALYPGQFVNVRLLVTGQ